MHHHLLNSTSTKYVLKYFIKLQNKRSSIYSCIFSCMPNLEMLKRFRKNRNLKAIKYIIKLSQPCLPFTASSFIHAHSQFTSHRLKLVRI